MTVRIFRRPTRTQQEMRAPFVLDSTADERSLSSEEIYRRHAQRVARWIGRLGGPGVDIEDLTQEVFLQVHRGRTSFRGDCKLTTWLYGITEHVVYARRRKDRILRLLRWTSPAPLEVETNEPTPLEALEQRQSRDLLYRALDRLRERYRSVLILFELEGLSCEDIADLKGLTLTTVWTTLSRGRLQLSREVERQERRTRGER